jgi:hypothetical protein
VRRLFGIIMLMLAAGTLSPAAVAAIRAPAGSPAGDSFGVQLVDIPVSEAGDPRALAYIIDYLPVGTVIHRRIKITNEEQKTAHFAVYADAAQIANGTFTGETGATPNELTGWISLQHPAVTLRAGASVTDLVTIKVPQVATGGEHYAVIWVQQSALAHEATGIAINEVSRVGIRVYLAVGRGGAPPTKFTITSVTGHRSAAGLPSIAAHVDNTGGRAVDLSGSVRLTAGPGGTSAGPFSARGVTLAPGQSGNVTFAPPKSLPNGPWRASVSLLSGITTVTATASVQFAGIIAAPPPAGGLSLMDWLGIALAAVVVIAAAGALVLARGAARRRHAPA